MYFCVCQAVTEQQVELLKSEYPIEYFKMLQEKFLVGTVCGTCLLREYEDLKDGT